MRGEEESAAMLLSYLELESCRRASHGNPEAFLQWIGQSHPPFFTRLDSDWGGGGSAAAGSGQHLHEEDAQAAYQCVDERILAMTADGASGNLTALG